MCGPFYTLSASSVRAVQRKLAWLALAGLSPLLSLGCAPTPTLTRLAPIQPTAALQGMPVALVQFVPLPKNYPGGAKPFFPTPTGELFEEERIVRRPVPAMTGLEAQTSLVNEKVTVRTFVPRDHQAVLTETMLLAMKENGLGVQLLPSVTAAKRVGAILIVSGALMEFKAGPASDWNLRFNWGFPTYQADIRVSITIFSGHTGARLWEGELHSTATHTKILTNALDANWITALDINERSFHPLRALLAVASYNLTAQLVEHLEQTALLAGLAR